MRDATCVLDEILANETELPILEHTTDTSGYTEIVFALFDLLGLTFTPRIKDLGDQQLYRTENVELADLPRVRARLSKRANVSLCLELWDDFLRFAGSLKLGWVTASLAIQRLQASPRKSQLARGLQEYGRLTKTLHALAWYESEEKRRWSNRQLNKGESVHALKAHLIVANRGVLSPKTDEGLQHQVRCLNLLTNAIILWNSVYVTALPPKGGSTLRGFLWAPRVTQPRCNRSLVVVFLKNLSGGSKIMTLAEAIQRFEAGDLGLDKVDKAKYLSLLCYYVSMIARGTYPELRQGDARSAEVLMIFNEVVHRVSSQLCSILTEEHEPTYPRNEFFPMLATYGKNEQLQAELAWALSRAWEIFLNSME